MFMLHDFLKKRVTNNQKQLLTQKDFILCHCIKNIKKVSDNKKKLAGTKKILFKLINKEKLKQNVSNLSTEKKLFFSYILQGKGK